MDEVFFTIVGMNHYLGEKVLDIGDHVSLIQEPSNEVDKEAIMVKYAGKLVGYVANSTDTVIHGTYSAGRLLETKGSRHNAVVMFKARSLSSGSTACVARLCQS